jgi:hypothetical protein
MIAKNIQTKLIQYIDGVNALVASNIAKPEEMTHAENARSKAIGSVEKREGTTIVGTDIGGIPFYTTSNYGVFFFSNGLNTAQTVYQVNYSNISQMIPSGMATISIANPGSGYAQGQVLSVLPVLIIGSGLGTVSLASGGTLYQVGDILTVSGGTAGFITVTTVGIGGVITGISINKAGTGYSVGSNIATTGGGDNTATINILTVASEPSPGGGGKQGTITVNSVSGTGAITGITVNNPGTGYTTGSGISTVGGGDNTATINILTIKNYYIPHIVLDMVKNQYLYIDVSGSVNYGIIGDAYYMANNLGSLAANCISYLNTGLYRVSIISNQPNPYNYYAIYCLCNDNIWRILPYFGPLNNFIPLNNVSTTVAEGNLYVVNQNFNPIYISGADGFTVYDGTLPTGNLYNAPKANLVNYYKGKLYMADYTYGVSQTALPNTILMSSPQLGILALLSDNVAVGNNVIPVTSTKYFIVGETVEFRRGIGENPITTGIISEVLETSIVLTFDTTVALEASDQIWVQNTFGSATKVFRWVSNPAEMGTNVLNYDTFKISSATDNDSERINVMVNVGNVMFIATANNAAIWNNYVLQNIDFGVGCCSKTAHIKCGGMLYFLHYTGVYATEGGAPKFISSKVEPYILGATKTGLQNAVAGKKGRSVFFCTGDVTLKNPDGSVAKICNNVCLEYNITQDNWFDHLNWAVNDMATYISSDNPDRLIGATTLLGCPLVEQLSAGAVTDIADYTGKVVEIPFRVDSANIMLGQGFQFISYPVEIDLEMERGMGMKAFVSLDRADFYEVEGEATKGLTVFKVTNKDNDVVKPPRCRNMRVSFRHIGKQLCRISKIALLSISTPEEEKFKEDGN